MKIFLNIRHLLFGNCDPNFSPINSYLRCKSICTIKAKYLAEDEMCDATKDQHGCFFAWLTKKIKTQDFRY